MSAKLRHAAKLMAQRLELFRRTRDQAIERGDRIDLAPEEFWESKDDEALSAYQDAVREINGERPLPFSEEAS